MPVRHSARVLTRARGTASRTSHSTLIRSPPWPLQECPLAPLDTSQHLPTNLAFPRPPNFWSSPPRGIAHSLAAFPGLGFFDSLVMRPDEIELENVTSRFPALDKKHRSHFSALGAISSDRFIKFGVLRMNINYGDHPLPPWFTRRAMIPPPQREPPAVFLTHRDPELVLSIEVIQRIRMGLAEVCTLPPPLIFAPHCPFCPSLAPAAKPARPPRCCARRTTWTAGVLQKARRVDGGCRPSPCPCPPPPKPTPRRIPLLMAAIIPFSVVATKLHPRGAGIPDEAQSRGLESPAGALSGVLDFEHFPFQITPELPDRPLSPFIDPTLFVSMLRVVQMRSVATRTTWSGPS